MRNSIARLAVTVCLTLGSTAGEPARGADSMSLPFTMTWIHGTCKHCETAQDLSAIQFVTRDEAWAVGYRAPGETGVGDYAIVHSRNGGRTWTELPRSYVHNDSPSVSFSSQSDGWVMVPDANTAEQRLLQTRDGGAHWHRLWLRDLFLRGIQYLGAGAGMAFTVSIDETPSYLFESKDYGVHWSKMPLPAGLKADHIRFIDARHGLLTGCLDRQVVIAWTTDAGRHWGISKIDVPPNGDSRTSYCDYEVDGLSVSDSKHGWLLANKHYFGLGDTQGGAVVSRTLDGGVTWETILRETLPTATIGFAAVQFLDDHRGFLAARGDSHGPRSKPSLLYTTDGGASWSPIALDHDVWACRPQAQTMMCAGPDFWMLRIDALRSN